MREVTREVFHQAVLTLNVHPSIVGNWPYTSIFKTPSGQERGRIVEFYPDGMTAGIPEKRYLLPE
jgi:hypothetical protein